MQNKNRGAAMVEFALVMPAFIMVFYSIVYGAFIMHDINALNEITRAAARYAVVETSGVSTADKGTHIKDFVGKKANETLYVYTLSKGTDVEVKEVTLDVGNDDSGQNVTEKGICITVSAKRKNSLPSMFLDLLPKDANGNRWLSTITSELTMRKES